MSYLLRACVGSRLMQVELLLSYSCDHRLLLFGVVSLFSHLVLFFSSRFFSFVLQGQTNNERDELIARERKLQVQVEDLRETMRHQQETHAQEKKELVRLNYLYLIYLFT